MAELSGIIFAFIPLFVVMIVANVAQSRREAGEGYRGVALLAYLLLALIYFLGILAGLALQLAQTLLVQQPELLEQFGLFDDGLGGALDSLALVGPGLWLPSLIGIILLLPPVRALVARFTRLDAKHPVHAVALSMSMTVFINLFITLGIGLDNLTTALQEQDSLRDSSTIAMLWVQQILTALLGAVGVGWLTRRSLSQTMSRLGIVRPTGREVLIGVGWAVAMLPAVIILEGVATMVGFGADPDVQALTEQLLGPLFQSPLGILTLGIAAALGEETLFRGAAQPRFGIVLTALLFALLHSNYGITFSTVIVFLLGLLLGWLRLRYNTVTSMTTHAAYNGMLGLIAYLSVSFFEF